MIARAQDDGVCCRCSAPAQQHPDSGCVAEEGSQVERREPADVPRLTLGAPAGRALGLGLSLGLGLGSGLGFGTHQCPDMCNNSPACCCCSAPVQWHRDQMWQQDAVHTGTANDTTPDVMWMPVIL